MVGLNADMSEMRTASTCSHTCFVTTPLVALRVIPVRPARNDDSQIKVFLELTSLGPFSRNELLITTELHISHDPKPQTPNPNPKP